MRKPVFIDRFAARFARGAGPWLLTDFCRLQTGPHDNATKSSELRHRNAADI
jgi:hypothetical protein